LGKETSARIVTRLIHPLDELAVVLLVAVSLSMLPMGRAPLAVAAALMTVGFLAFLILQRRGRVRNGFPFSDPPIVGYLNFSFRTAFLIGMAAAQFLASPREFVLPLLVLVSVAIYLKDYLKLVPDFVRYFTGKGPC